MDRFLITVGIWLAGSALRSFGVVWLRKAGAVLYLLATYFAGYYLSGDSHVGGAIAVMLWFLLPWLEIIFRVRAMRLPIHKTLTNRFPPSRDDFPHLRELTGEVEEAGFEMVEDAGWEAGEVKQFLRLLYHPEKRVQASISLSQQRGAGIVYLSLTTRGADGLTLTTTDYPFSNTMEQPPGVHVQRAPWAQTFSSFLQLHQNWLPTHGVAKPEDAVEVDAATLTERLSGELQSQIRHNLSRGLIKESGGGFFRYSWRGCFYLWRQFVKDMVKLA
jgi:hypothetical protein